MTPAQHNVDDGFKRDSDVAANRKERRKALRSERLDAKRRSRRKRLKQAA